jgi:hypothetical protein
VRVLAHAHTTYSGDGELRPQELADLAARRGFAAVLVSEHFEDLTAESFARLVAECRTISSCLMVPGYERDWRGYHVLAFGVQRWFDDASLERWAANVRADGGFLAMAHPGRYRHRIPDDILSVCDAVEVWNSKRGYDGAVGPNPRAYALLGGARLPICGQDLHGVRHASSVALEVGTSTRDRAVILEALRQGIYRMTNGLYAFDGDLSSPARHVLEVFHAGRTRLMSAAITIVRTARRARRHRTASAITK